MSLFISILTAVFIVVGMIVIAYRNKFRFIDEFGLHTGTALGLSIITFAIAIFLLINGVNINV